MQLNQQLQEANMAIQQLQAQLADKQQYVAIEKQRADIDALNHLALRYENERQDVINAFKAETERVKVLLSQLKPEQVNQIANKTVNEIKQEAIPGKEFDKTTFDPSQILSEYMTKG